eukprot:scpid110527/ scgid32615/ Probable RNA-directed DNA polymerase from transposon BS; Reverse transcriptase
MIVLQDYMCGFLDFQKAFDRVDHQVLLAKLKNIADARSCKWLESYLNSRHLFVQIEDVKSTPKVLTSGVTQGSHLAPILFPVYINDLPLIVKHSTPYIFADDVTLLLTHST